MRSKDLLEHLRRRPFRRFRLVLTDGRAFEVRHPELAMVGSSTVSIAPGAAARSRADPRSPGHGPPGGGPPGRAGRVVAGALRVGGPGGHPHPDRSQQRSEVATWRWT